MGTWPILGALFVPESSSYDYCAGFRSLFAQMAIARLAQGQSSN
jgi:hypothetical protein